MKKRVNKPEVLPESECLELLGSERIGRVALTVNALPAVLAVNYRLIDGTVMFYAGLGRRLLAALNEAVVAFEADNFDPDEDTGWTVVVVGTACHVTDRRGIEAAGRAGMRPGGDSDHTRLMRVRPEIITGRRVEHSDRAREVWGERRLHTAM